MLDLEPFFKLNQEFFCACDFFLYLIDASVSKRLLESDIKSVLFDCWLWFILHSSDSEQHFFHISFVLAAKETSLAHTDEYFINGSV